MSVKATIQNLDVVVTGLGNFNTDVREAAFYSVLEALDLAFKASYHMLSESDHTLRDLAMMGHPYGFTHPQTIHSPDELVHVQDGLRIAGGDGADHYRDFLKKISPRGAFGEIFEGRIVNESDLDRWIQEGTVHMRARPWMKWLVDHYGQDWGDLVEARITAAVRKFAA